MVTTYIPSFEEQIEEQRTIISSCRFLIEAYRTQNYFDKLHGLYDDIEEAEAEIERIEKERQTYMARVGYSD